MYHYQVGYWGLGHWLVVAHMLIIALSNYLVQIPLVLFDVNTTWGLFTFPFIFLINDLTVRLFGAILARKIIFTVMFPALILSYVVSVLFFNGHWVGLSALLSFNVLVGRIALASFTAYVAGQLMDITLFDFLKKKQRWWLAPTVSTIFGTMLDTLVFFSIAFYDSDDTFMASKWLEIAVVDYIFKIWVCGLFFLPLYGGVLRILIKLKPPTDDEGERITSFSLSDN